MLRKLQGCVHVNHHVNHPDSNVSILGIGLRKYAVDLIDV